MLIRDNACSVVRIADSGPTIELEPSEQSGILGQALSPGRAQYVSLDLRNKSQVFKALEGAEVVFHRAAPNSVINNHQLHYSVNVQGTKIVIDACVELKLKRLIYTSSPSVVSDGVHSIYYGNESLPYAQKPNDHYSATKAEAEALVLKANGRNGLLTCCIRPSSIFGPGDKLKVPWIVDAARTGKPRMTTVFHNHDLTALLSPVTDAMVYSDPAYESESIHELNDIGMRQITGKTLLNEIRRVMDKNSHFRRWE